MRIRQLIICTATALATAAAAQDDSDLRLIKIRSGDVAGLYAAINDSTNANTQVVLERPGRRAR